MVHRAALRGALAWKYLLLPVCVVALLSGKQPVQWATANALYLRLTRTAVPYTHAVQNRCLAVPEIDATQLPALRRGISDLRGAIQSGQLPSPDSAWRLLGRLSWLAGDLTEAQAAFRSDQGLSDDPMTRMELGVLAALEGQPARAATVLRSLGYSPDVLVQRGNQLVGVAGRYDESLICFTLATAMDPASYPARLGKARSLQMLGRNTQALEEINQALALCATVDMAEALPAELCATGYLYRGELRYALGEPLDQVEADFLVARRIAPGRYGIELNWVYWLVSRGRLDEAQPLAEQLLQTFPDSVEPYALLAGIYLAEGQTESAVDLIDQAWKRFPDSSMIQELREQNELQP
jgi:tetratricopeptide (TPR) repeat protein